MRKLKVQLESKFLPKKPCFEQSSSEIKPELQSNRRYGRNGIGNLEI
jgi:hypothetical protein